MRRTLENTFQTSARPRGTRPTAKDKRPGLQRPASPGTICPSQARQARLQVYGASSHVPRAASGVGEIARSSPRSGQAAGPHRGGTGGAGRAHREASACWEPDRRDRSTRRGMWMSPSCPVVSGLLSGPRKEDVGAHTRNPRGRNVQAALSVQALRVRVSTAGRRYGPFALGVRTPRLSLSLRTQEHPGALPRPLLRR